MNNDDFDYEDFENFMRRISGFYEAMSLNKTSREIEMMDELEVEVASRPCYKSVEELMNAIKEM